MLEAVDVTKRMPLHGRRHGQWFTAVDSASLTLETGKVVALVGESGSGKSTLARILTLGDEPSAGTIRLAGKEVSTRRRADRQAHFGQVQLIMQDPFASLNQLHRVGYILSRPLRNFGKDGDPTERIIELLERVNLTPGEQYIDKYPHELSGGQRQRVAIARALAADPVVLIGDEPVSMLDVSIRLDVLRLFADLCALDGMAMLYITHDIASARYFADEINVIYAARMVEGGPAEEVTQRPRHPYTQLLLESSPDPDRDGDRRTLPIVDASNEPLDREQELAGCPFAARCPEAMPVCSEQPPPMTTTATGHWSRCWLNN